MSETTEKKVLKVYLVNANVCDATGVQEETLQAYDATIVNAATLVTNDRARVLLSKYPVTLNVASQLNTPSDANVEVVTVNGRSQIGPGSPAPLKPTLLIVNGTLEIAPGAEEVLKGYCGFSINGKVVCPESITGLLSSASINGKVESYPDGCILLKNTAVLDRTFALRARQDARYYAGRRIVALTPDIDFENLAAKNVSFITRELLVAESLAETAMPFFDDRADVTVLPDGCAFVDGDTALDEALVRRYGKKLYINGNLTVNTASAPWLEQVEYLYINGEARVTRTQLDAFGRIDAAYEKLRIAAGTVLSDRPNVKVGRAMLEQAAEGLQLIDCVNVKFDRDVPPELLRERLVALDDCVNVFCTEEQRPAVELAANDVVCINSGDAEDAAGEEKKSGGLLSGLKNMMGSAGDQLRALAEELGLDINSIDIVRSVLGSRVVNGNICKM